jgi:formate hydrogenlyase subunit 6/NADH:ubiquinone oxidoreductase subunit I
MARKTIDLSNPHPQYKGEKAIDLKKCIGCGTCIKVCPTRAMGMRGGKAHVERPYHCVRCGHCASACDYDAITETGAEPKRITPAQLRKSPTPEALQFLLRSRRSVRLYKTHRYQIKILKRYWRQAGTLRPEQTARVSDIWYLQIPKE